MLFRIEVKMFFIFQQKKCMNSGQKYRIGKGGLLVHCCKCCCFVKVCSRTKLLSTKVKYWQNPGRKYCQSRRDFENIFFINILQSLM